MAKKIKCGCGAEAEVRTSTGKHQVPYVVCPTCGPIMGRKKEYIERIRREAYEVADTPPKSDEKPAPGAGQESDSAGHPPPRKSLFGGWGTVI